MGFERESHCSAFHENFNEKFNEVFIEGWIALSAAGKFEVGICFTHLRPIEYPDLESLD